MSSPAESPDVATAMPCYNGRRFFKGAAATPVVVGKP